MGPLLKALTSSASKLVMSQRKSSPYSAKYEPISSTKNLKAEDILDEINAITPNSPTYDVDAVQDIMDVARAGYVNLRPVSVNKNVDPSQYLYNLAKKYHPKANLTDKKITGIYDILTNKARYRDEFPIWNSFNDHVRDAAGKKAFRSKVTEEELVNFIKNYPTKESGLSLSKIANRSDGFDHKKYVDLNNYLIKHKKISEDINNLTLNNKISGIEKDYTFQPYRWDKHAAIKRKNKGNAHAADGNTEYDINKIRGNTFESNSKKNIYKFLSKKSTDADASSFKQPVAGHSTRERGYSGIKGGSSQNVQRMFNLTNEEYNLIKTVLKSRSKTGQNKKVNNLVEAIKSKPDLYRKFLTIEKMRRPQFITTQKLNTTHVDLEANLYENWFKKLDKYDEIQLAKSENRSTVNLYKDYSASVF